MNEAVINETYQLAVVGLIVFGLLVSPLFFIALDFWSGIRKAKERGEVITSDGWRQTVNKSVKYYNLLFALLLVDAIQVSASWYLNTFSGWSVPLFPWLLACGVCCVAAIEIKSIYESNDAKTKRNLRNVALLGAEIAKNRTDAEEIARAVVKYLNEKE